MKIAYLDLETSSLDGDVGRILCASVFSTEYGMITYRNDKFSKNLANDSKIAVATRDLLEEHNLLVGWYCKGFDIPFLRTRLAAAGKRVLDRRMVMDPCFALRGWHGLKPRSSKLKVAAEFFKVEDRKMDVDVSVWIDAALGGDRKALNILCERCESDVRILYDVTQKILDTGVIRNLQSY